MDEADARARINAQAPEEQRRAIADVLLDNSGSQGELVEKARDLWYNRVLPLGAQHPRQACRRAQAGVGAVQPGLAGRGAAHHQTPPNGLRAKALRVDHIGSTAVPGWTPRTSSTSRSRSHHLMSPTNSPSRWPTRAIRVRAASPAGRASRRRSGVVAASDFMEPPIQGGPPRPSPRRRLAQPAVRAVVRRLAEGQSRVRRIIWRSNAKALERATTPRRRNRGSLDAYGRAREWAEATGWRP